VAEPIRFPFVNSLAHRIANLITSDIELLEKQAFGQVTGWQSRFQRPYKAHYANDIAKRAGSNQHAMDVITKNLHEFLAKAQAYMRLEDRKGRPLTQFVHDANANPNLPQQKYSRSGKYARGGDGGSVEIVQLTPEQMREILGGAAQQQAQESESQDDKELAEAIARALTSGEAIDTEKLPQSNQAMGPDGKPIKRFDGPQQQPQIPVKKQAKRDSAEDMQKAMSGEAIPNVGEDRMREIADEQIAEHVPPMVQDGIKKTVPALIIAALNALKPNRVEVVLPDGKVIDVGIQHKQFPMLLKTLPRFPVWLPGPAGSGKTTAARNAARALSVPFHHHGAVDNVYQLLGFIDAGGTYHATSFRSAYEHGGVFLWDEVDASNPAALVAFNAAIENGECVFPDATIVKHPQCYFVAAANTYGTGATHEYVGRTKLDAATLDRFVMLDWHYDEKLERAIAGDTNWTTYVQRVREACKAAGIKHLVTPRASIRGNDLLDAGIDPATVIAMTVRKGLADDQWNNIRQRVQEYRP